MIPSFATGKRCVQQGCVDVHWSPTPTFHRSLFQGHTDSHRHCITSWCTSRWNFHKQRCGSFFDLLLSSWWLTCSAPLPCLGASSQAPPFLPPLEASMPFSPPRVQEKPHLWLDGLIPKAYVSNHLLGADDLRLQDLLLLFLNLLHHFLQRLQLLEHHLELLSSSTLKLSDSSLSSLLNLTLSSPSNLTSCLPLWRTLDLDLNGSCEPCTRPSEVEGNGQWCRLTPLPSSFQFLGHQASASQSPRSEAGIGTTSGPIALHYMPEVVSFWETEEWKKMKRHYNLGEQTFNQSSWGGEATKPTTFRGNLPRGRCETRWRGESFTPSPRLLPAPHRSRTNTWKRVMPENTSWPAVRGCNAWPLRSCHPTQLEVTPPRLLLSSTCRADLLLHLALCQSPPTFQGLVQSPWLHGQSSTLLSFLQGVVEDLD